MHQNIYKNRNTKLQKVRTEDIKRVKITLHRKFDNHGKNLQCDLPKLSSFK